MCCDIFSDYQKESDEIMIEKIKEKNVWDSLRDTELPIVIYGMGNGADADFSVEGLIFLLFFCSNAVFTSSG